MSDREGATILRLPTTRFRPRRRLDDGAEWDRLAAAVTQYGRRWRRFDRAARFSVTGPACAAPRWILPFPRSRRARADLRRLLADLEREVERVRAALESSLDPTPRRPAA